MSSRIERRASAEAGRFTAGVHPVLRRIYAARGLQCDDDLDLSLGRLLPVSSLPHADEAAELLIAHRGGRVLIVGDFDADGATSTALMIRALRALGFAHVDFLVPDRFRFGYGLTPEIVVLAAERRPSLIVTVDNGISSLAGVEAARRLSIPVLVTDHHLPGSELPRAAVIVNPNAGAQRFASSSLAGVGVAFYVIAALARALEADGFRAAELLDLVALGTVADVVPLDRNNRVLVAQVLRRIRAGRCVPGILALLEQAGRSSAELTAADLGFAVAPRLNAAGRLTDMSVGIACLVTDDVDEARRLAQSLSRLNEERREIEKRMQLEALDLAGNVAVAADGCEPASLCLFEETWHQGVVGLVAGRLKDRLHRPVVAFARADNGELRGSARSVSGVHIRDALDSIAARHPGLIEKFGGHALAAGMTLKERNLDEFRRALALEIAARADGDALRGVLQSDGELGAGEMSLETAHVIRAAGPWGQGFPEPQFDGSFSVLETRIVGERHLKLHLGGPGRDAVEAIAFGYLGGGAEDAAVRPGARVRVLYRLEVNEYRGNARMQLNCQHLSGEELA